MPDNPTTRIAVVICPHCGDRTEHEFLLAEFTCGACDRGFRTPPITSPAVAKLLAAADEVLTMAKKLRAQGRDADCLACAMFANEYVRTARAMQDLEDASRGR